jgi:uncharacterized protein (TIGR02145 family)
MKLIAKATTIILSNMIFLSVLFISDSSALTYSSNVEVGFTFNPTISLNLSGDLLINNLSPGSVSDSNTINVTVATNASQGYVLTATSGTKTTNTDLVNQTNSAYKFSSIATNASLSNLTTDNTWGYSYSEDSGTNWSNYSGLPLDNDDEGATGKQLINTINPADNRTLQFKIAARASSNQAAGTYQNTINFYAVANPDPVLQPVSCPAGKICYNANSLTPVVGEMGQQSATNGSTRILYASNFSRDGYGFAGWSDAVNGNGIKYGPNQTITAPDDISTNGYSLYAIWVKSAGNMQGWTGCSNLSQGEVTALKDSRDNDVYAVAKLADGKCWMIENLRLADKDSSNNDINLSNTNTHNPSTPLNNSWYYKNQQGTLTTSYHLSATSDPTSTNPDTAWCQANASACDDQSMLATNNTTLFTNNTSTSYSSSSNVYGYGNYYNWYSATAGHGTFSKASGNTAGDICPAGWHLPTGGSATADFGALDVAMDGTGDHQSTTEASNRWRTYPNNFVYSGGVSGSSMRNRNSFGLYWSSSADDSNYAYYLYFHSSYIYPGTESSVKYAGRMVRCVAGV